MRKKNHRSIFDFVRIFLLLVEILYKLIAMQKPPAPPVSSGGGLVPPTRWVNGLQFHEKEQKLWAWYPWPTRTNEIIQYTYCIVR